MNLAKKVGAIGAVDHLTRNGYKVVHRNYRYLRAEIDIIAKKGRYFWRLLR